MMTPKNPLVLKKHSIQAILFDLDGTIIDTEPAAAKVVVDSFREWGLEVDPEDAKSVTGRTWQVALQFLFGKYPIPVPTSEAAEMILRKYRETLKHQLFTIPGSVDAVKMFAKTYPLALVSGSHRSEILYALEKLGIKSCFKVILGAEDYPHSKPEPDGYVKAIQLLGIAPEQGLVFEDSWAGVTSAISAGLKVVAVTAANHFAHDLSAAHQKIKDFNEVHSGWLDQLVLRD